MPTRRLVYRARLAFARRHALSQLGPFTRVAAYIGLKTALDTARFVHRVSGFAQKPFIDRVVAVVIQPIANLGWFRRATVAAIRDFGTGLVIHTRDRAIGVTSSPHPGRARLKAGSTIGVTGLNMLIDHTVAVVVHAVALLEHAGFLTLTAIEDVFIGIVVGRLALPDDTFSLQALINQHVGYAQIAALIAARAAIVDVFLNVNTEIIALLEGGIAGIAQAHPIVAHTGGRAIGQRHIVHHPITVIVLAIARLDAHLQLTTVGTFAIAILVAVLADHRATDARIALGNRRVR